MDELIEASKNKLQCFRTKELKDVLTEVGLPKHGRKQDLIDRILALLNDEGASGVFEDNVNRKEKLVEVIDDVYSHYRMFQSGVNGSSSKKQNNSEKAKESYELERKIRCLCGIDVHCGSPVVQCVDPDCKAWQHVSCVIIPENPMEKKHMPTEFLCEICRVKRADPFWETVAHLLYPVKLRSTPIPCVAPHVGVEKSFKLTNANRELMQQTDYDVQAWCMLLNDGVPFRMQWPLHATLEVNGFQVKTVNRDPSRLLGANGRDDGAKIALYFVEGDNNVCLSGNDPRIFCFGVRLVRRRTLQQVLSMIPKESDGETFEVALARVQRCIGGGNTPGNDGNDSDLEVIANSISVNLRCPLSGSRMKTAGRFRACGHMGCFDLETFVALNEHSRKWQCPICLQNYSLEDVIIDPFFNLILNKMQDCAKEIHEIGMRPDGSWRVKNARNVGDLAQWHHPDGTIQVTSKQQTAGEFVSEVRSSLLGGLNNGVDHPAGVQLNAQIENFEPDSVQPNFSQTYELDYQNPNLSSACADVIVLSDSEDDISLVSPSIPAVPHNHEKCSASVAELNLNSYPAVTSDEDPSLISGTAGSANCTLVMGSTITADHQFPSADENIALEVLIPSPLISGYKLPNLNEIPDEDWFTLTTGANVNESSRSNVQAHCASASQSGMDRLSLLRSEEDLLHRGRTEPVIGPASGSDFTANGKRSGCSVTFPQQQRYVRRCSSIQASKDVTLKQS